MRIEIRNVAGIQSADITVDRGISLICGRNFAGKSTILKIGGGALCGVALPTSLLKKKDAKAVVRRGAKTGWVEATDEAGGVKVMYPACEVTTNGRAPAASPFAVGRSDVTQLDERERAKLLAQLLKTDPTRDDLAKALRDSGIAAEHLERTVAKAWELIEQHGWDGAAKLAQESGATLKGRWEGVTGESWGADKSRGWQPADTAQAVFGADRDALERAVTAAQAKVDEMVGKNAVGAAERAQLAATATTLETLHAAHADAETAVQAAAGAVEDAKKRRAALPSAETQGGIPCPHCQKPVVVRPMHPPAPGAYRLHPVEQISAAETKKRNQAIADADGEIGRLTGENGTASRAWSDAAAALKGAEDAQAKLDKLGPAAAGAGDDVPVTAARAAATGATEDLKAFDAKRQADEINDAIARTLVVVDLLRPDGVRKARLTDVLGSFNEGVLAELWEAAGWKAVAITPDLDVEYHATPLFLCSESEQWRARAVLRVAIAKLQGAPIVVLDSADILDNAGRNGLIQMLLKAGVPALVAMTIDAPPSMKVDPRTLVPDLAKHGIGCSYWVESGVAAPLGETAARAA